MKIMQEVAMKLKNWEEFVAKNQIEQDKQELMNCLRIKRRILRQWVNCWLKFRTYRTILIPCQTQELYDPESGSSSGVTHVPVQTPTILSPRTLPRCHSGLPRDTQNCGYCRKRFWTTPQEGQFSALFNNSKNLASTSQEYRPDTTGTTGRREIEMKREPLDSSIPLLHFLSGSGMLNHAGGTYSHSGMMDGPSIPISELHLGKFLDSMAFQSWRVNFKNEVCTRTADPQITMHWIKEVEIAKSIDEIMTSRDRLWSELMSLTSICLMWLLRLHWKSFSTRMCTSEEE